MTNRRERKTPPPITVVAAKASLLGFLVLLLRRLGAFLRGRQASTPTRVLFLVSHLYHLLPSVPISLSFAFFDAFFDSGQFLLQQVLVILQAFPFLLSGKEPAESRTASATTAGTSCQFGRPVSHSWLTHRNHLLSDLLRVFVHATVPV